MSYQPMNGAWYRVLTLDGEVIEKMQWRKGQFYGLRGRVLDLARVERLARRFAPGVTGDDQGFVIVNPNPAQDLPGYRAPVFVRSQQAAPPKSQRSPYGELPAALLVVLDEHGPLSTAELAERMAGRTAEAIRTALSRMTHAGTVSRTAEGRRWQIGAPTPEQTLLKGRPNADEAWTPGVWLHPHRAESLGLTKPRPREVDLTPLDYGDPRRRVAA